MSFCGPQFYFRCMVGARHERTPTFSYPLRICENYAIAL